MERFLKVRVDQAVRVRAACGFPSRKDEGVHSHCSTGCGMVSVLTTGMSGFGS